MPFCATSPYSSIAQSVEHAAVNRGVVGSSPTGGAKKKTRECFAFAGFLYSFLFLFLVLLRLEINTLSVRLLTDKIEGIASLFCHGSARS